jgi:hypothetical protein
MPKMKKGKKKSRRGYILKEKYTHHLSLETEIDIMGRKFTNSRCCGLLFNC